MRINTNISAMNTHRMLNINNQNVAKSTAKLSSGLRINGAYDDAAGLSISEKMRSQIRGLTQASRNADDGISLLKVAEGALDTTHAALQRMNELATQAANDTNVQVDRQSIQIELNSLSQEIDKIAKTTTFNTLQLLDGTFDSQPGDGRVLKLQVGAVVRRDEGEANEIEFEAEDGQINLKTADYEVIGINIGNMHAAALKLEESDVYSPMPTYLSDSDTTDAAERVDIVGAGVDLENIKLSEGDDEAEYHDQARVVMQNVQAAIQYVSVNRSRIGATINRLEYTIKNLDNTAENTSAAESRVRDVDMAKEMMTLTKNNVLSQAATAMLAQANQLPQNVLQLLR